VGDVMSLNAALNATIALIENRPAQFREMLREPTSDVKNISPVYSRMIRSLDFYAATKIRIALMAACMCNRQRNSSLRVRTTRKQRAPISSGASSTA